MGYEDRDEPAEAGSGGMLQTGLSMLVRGIGLAVLLVGLWVGVKVILEAWALYEDPSRIVRFADDIQKHSNLDGVIGSLAASDESTQVAKPGGSLRLSYFAAWFIVLLLMFVIGSLAMAAIATGGQLVLYDLGLKQYSRGVMREVRNLRRA